MSLFFFSHFCPRTPQYSERITVVDYAIDHFVDAIDRRSSYSPLLNYDRQSFFEFGST
jgi:hypothetical protein